MGRGAGAAVASGSMSKLLVRLKITLDGVEPAVYRRVLVPYTIRLHRLHQVIQAAMGWTDTHLYEFLFKGVNFGIPDPDYIDGPLDARNVTLKSALEDVGAKTFKYLYDFGDAWYHTIKVEKFFDDQPFVDLPFLLECAGHCPPEDVGGPDGYANFLAAYYDPNHLDYAQVREWHPDPINPTDPRMPELDAALEKLQKAWAKKTPAKRLATTVKN
jgi:hypothetical protein